MVGLLQKVPVSDAELVLVPTLVSFYRILMYCSECNLHFIKKTDHK